MDTYSSYQFQCSQCEINELVGLRRCWFWIHIYFHWMLIMMNEQEPSRFPSMESRETVKKKEKWRVYLCGSTCLFPYCSVALLQQDSLADTLEHRCPGRKIDWSSWMQCHFWSKLVCPIFSLWGHCLRLPENIWIRIPIHHVNEHVLNAVHRMKEVSQWPQG